MELRGKILRILESYGVKWSGGVKMELRGKIQRILKSYGVKWSYGVKY